MATRTNKALIGRQAIMDYLGIGKGRFYELMTAGLPIEKRGKKSSSWIGHADELDDWFRVKG